MQIKEAFKYIIKEFHESARPDFIERQLVIPDTTKVISLVGPRRAGKTFYFYQLIHNLTEDMDKVEGGIRYVPLWKWMLV